MSIKNDGLKNNKINLIIYFLIQIIKNIQCILVNLKK